jgi:hypothetical protein
MRHDIRTSKPGADHPQGQGSIPAIEFVGKRGMLAAKIVR